MIADNLVVDRGVSAGDTWITVDPANIREALSALKDSGYRLLVFLTCVDHLADASRSWPARYELVYELRNMDTPEHLRVRAFIDGDPPRVDSVHDLFPPANWEERETYDMFGVMFEGNRDLRRIYMPPDYTSFPLRKDFYLPDDAARSPGEGVRHVERTHSPVDAAPGVLRRTGA